MDENIKEVYADIESALLNGYSVKDLKLEDKREVDGFVWGVLMTENAFDNYVADLDEESSIFDRIKNEVAEELWEKVYQSLLCDAADLVCSIEDGYDEE